MNPTISIIVPVFNEAERLGPALTAAAEGGGRDVELVVVDGGSADGTLDVARRAGARVLTTVRCRAAQINAGAAQAGGRYLLFLHADTRLPQGYVEEVVDLLGHPGTVAGAFRLRIDAPGKSLRVIEAAANWRARRLRMPYGDQAVFLSAERFKRLGGFPDLPLMEDYEFVRRLRRTGSIEISHLSVRTSARRWQRLGPWRATLINVITILRYRLGADPARLARWYRKGRLLGW